MAKIRRDMTYVSAEEETELPAIPVPDLSGEVVRYHEALEGEVFYEDEVTHGINRTKYFPHFDDNDPLVSVPLTGAFIDRMVNILRNNVRYTTGDPNLDIELTEMVNAVEFEKTMNNICTQTLATGSHSAWIDTGFEWPVVTTWAAYYTSHSYYSYYKQYGTDKKTGEMSPVLTTDGRSLRSMDVHTEMADEYIWASWYNDDLVWWAEHNMGFTPVVWFDSIDTAKNLYGKPFVERFKDLLVSLNNIYSQVQRSIILLQNVWTTTKSFEDANKPIRLNPKQIQFLGPEGKLEQAIRNLDLEEEREQIKSLKIEILRAANFPADSFLEGLGKVSSGVALRLQYTCLFELMNNVGNTFAPVEAELLEKMLRLKHKMAGRSELDVTVNVEYDMAVLPVDKQADFDYDVKRVEQGVMTREAFINKWADADDIPVLLAKVGRDVTPEA